MTIERVRVPIGVVVISYESRPNVPADAASLCLKAAMLRFCAALVKLPLDTRFMPRLVEGHSQRRRCLEGVDRAPCRSATAPRSA